MDLQLRFMKFKGNRELIWYVFIIVKHSTIKTRRRTQQADRSRAIPFYSVFEIVEIWAYSDLNNMSIKATVKTS